MTALTCFLLTCPLVQDHTTLGAQQWLMRAMPGYRPALAAAPLSVSSPTTHLLWLIALYVLLPPFECVMSLKLTLDTVSVKYSDRCELGVTARI